MRIRNVFASFLIAFALLGKWEVQQTVTTAVGAKTMDIDTENHKVYLPTAEFEEAKPRSSSRRQARDLYDRRRGAPLSVVLEGDFVGINCSMSTIAPFWHRSILGSQPPIDVTCVTDQNLPSA